MKNNKVKYDLSIIICCYNSSNFIEDTLESIKNIDQNKIQVVILNDGSNDDTYDKLKKYKSNKNYKLITQPNKGLAIARNEAIKNCDSNWISILDHDDKYTKEKINICNQFSRESFKNEKCIYFGNAIIKDLNGSSKSKFSKNHKIKNKINLKKNYCYYELLIHGCFLVSSTVIFNKDIINEIGNFDKQFIIACDFDFFLRASKKFDFKYIDSPLCEWINRKTQLTSKKKIDVYRELINIYQREINNNSFKKLKSIYIYTNLIKYSLKKLFLNFLKYGFRFKI